MQCRQCRNTENFETERRLYGYTTCLRCGYKAPSVNFQQKIPGFDPTEEPKDLPPEQKLILEKKSAELALIRFPVQERGSQTTHYIQNCKRKSWAEGFFEGRREAILGKP